MVRDLWCRYAHGYGKSAGVKPGVVNPCYCFLELKLLTASVKILYKIHFCNPGLANVVFRFSLSKSLLFLIVLVTYSSKYCQYRICNENLISFWAVILFLTIF